MVMPYALTRPELPKAALRWAPPGKRKRGRPLGTWRRTVESEMGGKTWNELSWLAQDRDAWRRGDMVAPCAPSGVPRIKVK